MKVHSRCCRKKVFRVIKSRKLVELDVVSGKSQVEWKEGKKSRLIVKLL